MTIGEIIEDAFLDALEQGAKPPRRELTIRLPFDAWYRVGQPEIEVAGFLIFIHSDAATREQLH